MRNLEEFNKKHSGSMGVVIASGPSLHGQDLSVVSKYTTIAVNSGYVACPDADYYISDDWEVSLWSYFACDLRKSEKTTVLLYEDKLGDKSHWFGDRSVLFRHRQGYHITDSYEHSCKENHIVQCRTSVGSAIHVAHIMGCDPILVLGLDCCRNMQYRWFWQYPDFCKKPYRLDGRLEDKYHKRKNRQVNTDTDLIAILRYWQRQGKEINKSCRVYNGSKSSLVDVFSKVDDLNEFVLDYEQGKV